MFGQQTPAQSNALALIPSQQAQQAQASAQYQVLITKENKPIVHSTAWDDIHPEGQKYLLELECASLVTAMPGVIFATLHMLIDYGTPFDASVLIKTGLV